MAQIKTVSYHALDTSRLQNKQLEATIKPGLYKGFMLRANAGDQSKLDITYGSDGTSVLVTSEGVRIEEDQELLGAVAIDNADANLPRIDLVVAEYQYTTNNQVAMTYKAIRGRYPATPTTTPNKPTVESEFQIPIAYVNVRPQTAFTGPARAIIATDDIIHIAKSINTLAPENISSLMPIIEPSDDRRVFVHAGLLPSFDGTTKIDFAGGYSEIIDPTTLATNETRYYQFGISDDQTVTLIGDSADIVGLPQYTRDIFPVCYIKAKKIDDRVKFLELTDLRFPFARQLSPVLEEEVYKSTLAGSVFKHVRVDLFRDLDGIELTSISSDATVVAELDRGTTSLVFSSDVDPIETTKIATKNVLRDTSITNVEHFMVVAETDFDGLEVKFSVTSAFSGFVSAVSRTNSIVRIPAGGSNKLYIQFLIPPAAFAGGKTPHIYSYGCFMTIDENVVNTNTISDIGVADLKNAVPNLIANGNFRHWSRDDVNGNPVDVDLQTTVAYPVSADSQYAADGWQFTDFTFDAVNGQVKRVGLSKDVIAANIDNSTDTALEWLGVGGSGGVNILEYRVPVPAGAIGRRITFACKYKANSIAAVGLGIVFYEITAQKTLKVQGDVARVAASVTTGDMLVQSSITAGESTYCVGFRVYLNQLAGQSSVYLWNARAAVGEYKSLPYNEETNAQDVLRKYYERGRVYTSQNAIEGNIIGTSCQFGAKKYDGIGTLIAQVSPFSDSNRSINVNDPSFDVDSNGCVITAEAVSAGLVRIDIDFEAFVKYTKAL